MRPGGMRGDMRGGMMQQRGNFHGGGFHGGPGGPGGHFRGGEHGSMGGDFRIAPAGTWWKNPRVVERLSLTADQTKKMDDIVQQSRLQLIDLRANLEKQQLMLEPMLSANPLDTAKASAQIDKVAQARADLEKSNARMLLGIRGVLTPDQWTKLHERPAPPAPAGGAGALPAASGGGPGRWRGQRPGGPGGGNGMDNLVAPIDPQ
jgi:Spy/CpxP family protein refolding chaperone